MNVKLMVSVIAVTAGLSACGGGGGGGGDVSVPTTPSAGNEVPASATASPTAYSRYVGGLTASEVDAPLDVEKVEAPTSEDELPIDDA